jgi:heavy metal translocating P-type ATPase
VTAASRARWTSYASTALPAFTLLVIAVGAALRSSPRLADTGDSIWRIFLWIAGAWILWRTIREAAAGHFATDVVATLAIVTAVLLDQPLPGLIVVLMLTGGEALERRAQGRASHALRELQEAAPRIAHRVTNGAIIDIPAEAIEVGDELLIRPGEMIASDGVVMDGRSHVDTSRVTGEPIPVSVEAGAPVSSGTTNLEGSISVRATARAAESQYARIVELVRSAQASKAPLQRLADRYAVWFTPLTLATCAITYLVTRDPTRVLAVLVVATPCPLILAAPVAIIGGISAAARHHVIVRNGDALESLASVSAAIFDKTGTLTVGTPRVSRIVTMGSLTENVLLHLAASVEQGSGHHLARTVVQAAHEAGLLLTPAHVTEVPGRGVVGTVGEHEVLVGAKTFLLERYPATSADIERLEQRTDGLRAWVAVGGAAAGVIEYADMLRPGAAASVRDFRALGINRILVRSGDTQSHTAAIATAVGIDDARGDLLPEDKVTSIRELIAEGERVVMIGDGTNDAPALGVATVGVALAGHGGGITAEAADVVVLADDLGRVVNAIRISRRTLRIARESIWVGLGLSGVAMGFAAAGAIAPVTGAILQEVIDIAVIVNALRASFVPNDRRSARGSNTVPNAPTGPHLPLDVPG